MSEEEPDGPLTDIVRELESGKSAYKLTVRQLLNRFGVRRRGYVVVQTIEEALEEHDLVTSPDFAGEHIDTTIEIVKQLPSEAEDRVPGAEGSSMAQEPSEEPDSSIVDPTLRLSRLPSANRAVASVFPTDPIERAATIMLAHKFSQLAVMTSPWELKGVVSWRSIGESRAWNKSVTRVSDCMDLAHERAGTESVFSALPTIVEHEYVLVRGPDRKISGIVTASDLGEQFQQLAEPFLLIGEIENHIRQILKDVLTVADLPELTYPEGAAPPRKIDDMNFGQYHAAFAKSAIWERFKLAIDRKVFCEKLDAVRELRNDIMHFDPDPFDDDQLKTLRDFAEMVRKLADARVQNRVCQPL